MQDESYSRFDWSQLGMKEFTADPIEQVGPLEIFPPTEGGSFGNFINISDGALLFDEIVYDACQDFIEAAGQVFPVCVKGVGNYRLLNVLETCNPVDKKASASVLEDWRAIVAGKRLVFKENRIFSISSLFKIPELEYKPILTFSEADFHEWDFQSIYKSNGWTGLVFKEIWVSG